MSGRSLPVQYVARKESNGGADTAAKALAALDKMGEMLNKFPAPPERRPSSENL